MSVSDATWLDQHKAKVAEAHRYLQKARQELNGEAAAADPRMKAQARATLMNVTRALTVIERLAHQLPPTATNETLQSQTDVAEIRRMHKELGDLMARGQSTRAYQPTARPEETTETRQYTDQDLMQLHQDGIRQQDEQLDRVERGVHRVHQQAQEMHSEITDQNRLIEQLDHEVDDVGGRLQHVTSRLDDVLRRANPKLMYCLYFFVPFVIVFLLFYLIQHWL